MSEAHSLTEKELAEQLEKLLEQRNLTLLETEVKIGAFRLDAVAHDQEGALVIVELKTSRWCGTLAQLLLYPRALEMALTEALGDKDLKLPVIRSLLITTYLDKGLYEWISNNCSSGKVEALVCIGSTEEGLRLVSGEDISAADVVHDQATQGNALLGGIESWVRDQLS